MAVFETVEVPPPPYVEPPPAEVILRMTWSEFVVLHAVLGRSNPDDVRNSVSQQISWARNDNRFTRTVEHITLPKWMMQALPETLNGLYAKAHNLFLGRKS